MLMPNIIMKSGSTLSSAYFSLDAGPNGTFNLDKTLWTGDFDYNFTSGKKQTIKNSGFKTDVARVFNLTSQVEAPEIETISLTVQQQEATKMYGWTTQQTLARST